MKKVAVRDWWEEKEGCFAFLSDGTRCKVFEDKKRPIWDICDYWLVPIIEVDEDKAAETVVLPSDAYMVSAIRYRNEDGDLVCECPRFGEAYRHWWPEQPRVAYAIVAL